MELHVKNTHGHALRANVLAAIMYFYTSIHALLELWVVKAVHAVVKVGQGPATEATHLGLKSTPSFFLMIHLLPRLLSSLVMTQFQVTPHCLLTSGVQTYSGWLKVDKTTDSIVWACSLELLTNDCLHWISFVTELFCIFVFGLLIYFYFYRDSEAAQC